MASEEEASWETPPPTWPVHQVWACPLGASEGEEALSSRQAQGVVWVAPTGAWVEPWSLDHLPLHDLRQVLTASSCSKSHHLGLSYASQLVMMVQLDL